MASIRLCIAAITSLSLMQPVVAQPQDDSGSPKAINLILGARPDARLVTAVANIGEPMSIHLAPGETPRKVIEARCGIVEPAYIEAMLALNRANGRSIAIAELDRSAQGQVLDFPACIRVDTSPVEVAKGQTIEALYVRQGLPFDARAVQDSLVNKRPFASRPTSSIRQLEQNNEPVVLTSANSGFTATEYARQFIRDNPGVNPAALKPGATVQVASAEIRETIPLRDGIDPNTVANQLHAGADLGVQVEQATVAAVVDHIPEVNCPGSKSLDEWPMPVRQLLDAVAENARYRRNSDPYIPARVLVVDTGLKKAMLGRAIPESALTRIRSWNGEGDRQYLGVNTAMMINDATPPPGLSSANHGGEVAATLLGGRFLEAHRNQFPLPRLAFVSIARSAGGSPYLDIGAISRAYRYSINSKVLIVNTSVEAMDRRDVFMTDLKVIGNQTLIVSAAGNTNSLYKSPSTAEQPWPGSLGGAPGAASPGVVVSVGAHDPNGKLLDFSRIGKLQVDLLAPGCDIPTFSLDTALNTVEFDANGTSYAAPIVSLIAALLASEELDSLKIKERLLISVDMDEDLVSKVYSGGRLNVRKALSVYRDVAEYLVRDPDGNLVMQPNGKPVTRVISGILLSGGRSVGLCEDEALKQEQIRKLAVTQGHDGQVIRGWRKAVTEQQITQMTRLERCPGSPPGEMVFATEDGGETTIPLADIRDFVAREF